MTEIKAIQVMLPYLNDCYMVGKTYISCNQVSGEFNTIFNEYGLVLDIKEVKRLGSISIQNEYLINFENGSTTLLGVPVQLIY